MATLVEECKYASPGYGWRVQYVFANGWHTQQYLAPGERVAILPVEFDPLKHEVLIVERSPIN